MKVTLQTQTDVDALRVRVVCDEVWSKEEHFDSAISTLEKARQWLVAQQMAGDK